MTTRETSFRESDHPGIVFPGKLQSGKRLSGEKNHPGKVTIRETTVNRLSLQCSTLHKQNETKLSQLIVSKVVAWLSGS